MKPLREFLAEIPDPRSGREKSHDHIDILLMIIIGFLAGKSSLRRIVKWGRRKEKFLKKHLRLKNGIPSVSTFSRIASAVDAELLALILMNWIGSILDTRGIHIIIDGKALRGATDKLADKRAPYILNAIDAATRLVIGQLSIPEKTGEATAIPKLLELLDITGSTITIDAIGTSETIMSMINSNSGYFVMQVKKNCPATYNEITALFDQINTEIETDREKFDKKYKEKYSEHTTSEVNRERYENRTMKSYTGDASIGRIRDELPFVRTVGLSLQVRIPKEVDEFGIDITPSKDEFIKSGSRKCPKPVEGDGFTDNIQKVGMISNRILGARELADYRRSHWRIENCLHHVLDEDFGEDKCVARQSKDALSVLRKISYNVARLMQLEDPVNRIQMIDIMDEVDSDLTCVAKFIFEPIPSMY